MSIEIYSNPQTVFKKAKQLLGNDVIIELSNRKDKKYRILNPYTNKYINFGQMGYEDYTKHKDKNRRNNFRIRNNKWANYPIYTPAFLSYWLLW